MGYVAPHPSLAIIEEAALSKSRQSSIKSTAKASSSNGSGSSTSPPPTSLQSLTNFNPKTAIPAELEHQIVMSMVERVIAMIRSRRGLKAIESFEQVQFLVAYTGWLRRVA